VVNARLVLWERRQNCRSIKVMADRDLIAPASIACPFGLGMVDWSSRS
jgi:hypothetical protein